MEKQFNFHITFSNHQRVTLNSSNYYEQLLYKITRKLSCVATPNNCFLQHMKHGEMVIFILLSSKNGEKGNKISHFYVSEN